VDDVTTRQLPAASPATAPITTPRAAAPAALPTVGATPTPSHEVRIVDGRFAHAECSCGWRGAGRRTRSTARAEARDHALLYADSDVRVIDVR
jgi:hypothetical protein